MTYVQLEIDEAERQLEFLVEALIDGRLTEVALSRQGTPAARLIGPPETDVALAA